jgi:peptidoglycan/LPS O-acetylase OafA/YrhL
LNTKMLNGLRETAPASDKKMSSRSVYSSTLAAPARHRSAFVLAYHPRLDGIRALAVAFVLQQHFTFFAGRFGLGFLGVRMFFVLSGYLISRIILDYARRNVRVAAAAREFYWRRILRLSPPLCLAIMMAALLNLGDMRADWPWHLSYLTNVKIYLQSSWGPASHFWSLAVEEQFYLIWFFLLILTSLRNAFVLILAGIVLAPLYRTVSFLASGDAWAGVLLPGTMDFFCLGALIAYAERLKPELDAALRSWLARPAVLVLAFGGCHGGACAARPQWSRPGDCDCFR